MPHALVLTLSKRARHLYGANFVPKPKARGLLELMWDALHDTTLIILLIAASISFALGLSVG
jgi:magnesium-transporting ATPase (P-type)